MQHIQEGWLQGFLPRSKAEWLLAGSLFLIDIALAIRISGSGLA